MSDQTDIGDIGGDNLMTWKQGHKLVSVPTNQPSQNQSNQASSKCGVICQKKKKRKVLLIGFGVLLVGGISYFILKKK